MTAQMTLPWEVASELDQLLREFQEEDRLISIGVEHQMATCGGWKQGWYARITYMTHNPKTGSNGPCSGFGHSMDGPVEALVDALRQAREHTAT